MSDDKRKKYLSPEDNDSVILEDKSQIHKEAVRADLETSIKQDMIHPQEYYTQPQHNTGAGEIPQNSYTQQYDHSRQASLNGGQPEAGYTYTGNEQPESRYIQQHRQEDARRYNETLDSVKFDGDIDLDREKKRDQLGFQDYDYGSEKQPQHRSFQQPQSNAERFSHINNVQETHGTENVRYGSVEREAANTAFVGGAAGAATIAGSAATFKVDSDGSKAFRSAIKGELTADSLKADGIIKPSEAAAFADSVWGSKDTAEKKGVIKTAAGVLGREVENAVGQGGGDGDITDRAKGQAVKYGYKTGKYAAVGAAVLGQGALRIARYGKKLSNDVATGVLTKEASKKALMDRAGISMKGSLSSVGGIIKTGAVKAVEDFHGSDDLGMQAITKPKDVIVTTKRSLKMAKATGRSLSKGVKTTKKTAEKVAQGGKAIAAAAKKIFSNPVVLKGIGIAAAVGVAIALIVAVVSSVSSIFSTLSLKSDDWELSQTYLYVTELDARMEEDIITEDTKWHFPSIDVFKYYLNGVEVSKDNMGVDTNADLMLALFDSKYDDYSFADVKPEIETIHAALYQVEKTRWTEEIQHDSSHTDPDTGEEIDDSWTETIYHMDVYLTTQSLDNYLETNKDTLLTADEQEKLTALQEVGVYSFRKELASPFVGVDWSTNISDRWGWRIHPISGDLSQHLGVDIAMAGGTPINACMTGTASVGWDAGGYGNYVTITDADGNYTLYGHMSATAVSNGQTVSAGDVIGYVGTTGNSTGNHLHLEYHKDGHVLNPLIFVECDTTN